MQVKEKDKVKVHYTLKINDGEVVESSKGGLSMEFALGEGKVIPGFEKGLIGMKVGEEKTLNIPVEDAYGPREDRKVFEFGRDKAPKDFDPQIGQTIQMHAADGSSFPVTVVSRTEKGFKMDANHPLAGYELTFELEVVEIIR